MPTTDHEKPDARLLFRVLYTLGAIFAVVMGVFFVRSAPKRSSDACVTDAGISTKAAECLACHIAPHRQGQGYQIRRVDSRTGLISTVTRNSGLRDPEGIVTDASGHRYGISTVENLVWKLVPEATQPIILAGKTANGRPLRGFSGDNGPSNQARLNHPSSLALDSAGNLYIADTLNHRVRRVRPDGLIETVAGNGKTGFKGDGQPATKANLERPTSLLMDGDTALLIAESNGREGRIRRLDLETGVLETTIGNGNIREHKGDGQPARDAVLKRPIELTRDEATGDLYIAESRPVLRHWNIGNCALCHRLP